MLLPSALEPHSSIPRISCTVDPFLYFASCRIHTISSTASFSVANGAVFYKFFWWPERGKPGGSELWDDEY